MNLELRKRLKFAEEDVHVYFGSGDSKRVSKQAQFVYTSEASLYDQVVRGYLVIRAMNLPVKKQLRHRCPGTNAIQ